MQTENAVVPEAPADVVPDPFDLLEQYLRVATTSTTTVNNQKNPDEILRIIDFLFGGTDGAAAVDDENKNCRHTKSTATGSSCSSASTNTTQTANQRLIQGTMALLDEASTRISRCSVIQHEGQADGSTLTITTAPVYLVRSSYSCTQTRRSSVKKTLDEDDNLTADISGGKNDPPPRTSSSPANYYSCILSPLNDKNDSYCYCSCRYFYELQLKQNNNNQTTQNNNNKTLYYCKHLLAIRLLEPLGIRCGQLHMSSNEQYAHILLNRSFL